MKDRAQDATQETTTPAPAADAQAAAGQPAAPQGPQGQGQPPAAPQGGQGGQGGGTNDLPPDVQAKLDQLAKLQAEERKRQEADLTEQERVRKQQDDLRRDRYHFELEKAGATPDLLAALETGAPSDEDMPRLVKAFGKAIDKIKADAKAAALAEVRANGQGGLPPVPPSRPAGGASQATAPNGTSSKAPTFASFEARGGGPK